MFTERTSVGLDVHATSVAAAAIEGVTGELCAERLTPSYDHMGHDFLSYAVPTIRGELRKHFRDHGWMIRPPRRIQELQARISSAQAELS